MGFLPSLPLCRLAAFSTLALCLACAPKDEAPGETPADLSPRHVAKRLLGKLLAQSPPVEAEGETSPPPAPPASSAQVEEPAATNICPPETGPVTVLVVASEQAVRSGAAQYAGEPVLHRDTETVIFEDGKIITSNVEAVGDHLNQLGWANRELKLLSSVRQRHAYSGGGDWRASSGTKKSRRRRRRG